MDISEELRQLADKIDGLSINNIEDINIQVELISEFLIRLGMIKEHVERKRAQSPNLCESFIDNFISDYKYRINKLSQGK